MIPHPKLLPFYHTSSINELKTAYTQCRSGVSLLAILQLLFSFALPVYPPTGVFFQGGTIWWMIGWLMSLAYGDQLLQPQTSAPAHTQSIATHTYDNPRGIYLQWHHVSQLLHPHSVRPLEREPMTTKGQTRIFVSPTTIWMHHWWWLDQHLSTWTDNRQRGAFRTGHTAGGPNSLLALCYNNLIVCYVPLKDCIYKICAHL